MRRSPPNSLGSVTSSVASEPVISMSVRRSGDSKLSTIVAVAPLSNSASAATWVGTSTGNSTPARGPFRTTRVSIDRVPSAATRVTDPSRSTRAVR